MERDTQAQQQWMALTEESGEFNLAALCPGTRHPIVQYCIDLHSAFVTSPIF